MSSIGLVPRGPRFGPNFLIVTVDDNAGQSFTLQVYPDAANPDLKAAGLATHYYYLPQRVFIAQNENSKDFEFGITIFKGLQTRETHLISTDQPITEGSSTVGGGYCTFATTFAIRDEIIPKVIEELRKQGVNDPTPRLGIVPIIENDVNILSPNFGETTGGFYLNAQGQGKGSIEAKGINSYLVTLNQLAAGVIVGGLKSGVSPFVIQNKLSLQFYADVIKAEVKVNLRKLYDELQASASVGGFLGIRTFALEKAYDRCVTSGAIQTTIIYGSGPADDKTKDMIDKQVQAMIEKVYAAVQKEIFDFQPVSEKDNAPEKGIAGKLFSGFSAKFKKREQVREMDFPVSFTVEGIITVAHDMSGTLDALQEAISKNPEKYIAEIDVGEFFQKVQVVGNVGDINFPGTVEAPAVADPIKSIDMQVGYPEFSKPLDNNNNPNLRIKAEGFHYEIGKRDPNRPEELGKWTAKNSGDLVNFSFLRIKEPLPNWGIDDVLVKTTLIFDGGDPRVDFENGQTVFETEEKTNRHNITFNRMSQGYFSMKFIFRPLKTKAIVYTMNCTMGDRKDSFVIDESSVDNVVWEFYSNKKYMEETSFTYEIEAVAFGPDPTDDEIKFRSPSPIKVNVSSGPIKIGKAQISYPDEPPEHTQKIKEYIKAFQAVT